MKFDEKLQKLRKEKGLSQEELAEMMSVSRQAVSRWESGLSYPETEKIITLSEIFGVTVDSLLKEGMVKYSGDSDIYEPYWVSRGRHYEYKSKTTLFGLPLVHVNIGWRFKRAKGIIAIGNISTGFISIGLLSLGFLTIAPLSIGFFSIGLLAIALLVSLGPLSLGTFAIGALAVGMTSLGALSIGKYAVGALAIATDIAVGDYAYGYIAAGRFARGTHTFIDNISATNINADEVKRIIYTEFPNIKEWFVNFTTFFLR